MNIKYHCEQCEKENVCKYCDEYKKDLEKFSKGTYCTITEIIISCTEFLEKRTSTIKR